MITGEKDNPLRSSFGALVGQTARQWRRAVDRELQPFGLTEATWLPLLHVYRAATPMRQKDLAASLGLDGSSVVRLIDSLAAAGLVERREEGGDRRAKAIVLTARGRATVVKVERSSRRVAHVVLADVSDADLALAHATLLRVVAALSPLAQEDA